MDVQARRDRTNEILERYRSDRARISTAALDNLSTGDVNRIEGMITEATRLLRENKTDCVRSEQRDAERIGGQRWAETSDIDLGYEQVKDEIDKAIGELNAEKVELRATNPRSSVVAMGTPRTQDATNDQLIRLADLHELGILTLEEFAAAKERLLH